MQEEFIILFCNILIINRFTFYIINEAWLRNILKCMTPMQAKCKFIVILKVVLFEYFDGQTQSPLHSRRCIQISAAEKKVLWIFMKKALMYTIFTLFLFLDFYFELTFKHLNDVLSHIGVQRYFKFIRTFKNGQQEVG